MIVGESAQGVDYNVTLHSSKHGTKRPNQPATLIPIQQMAHYATIGKTSTLFIHDVFLTIADFLTPSTVGGLIGLCVAAHSCSSSKKFCAILGV